MGILDRLLVKSDAQVEGETAKPLIDAEAETRRMESAAKAEATRSKSVMDNFASLVNSHNALAQQAKSLGMEIEDYLAALELTAESEARVAKLLKA